MRLVILSFFILIMSIVSAQKKPDYVVKMEKKAEYHFDMGDFSLAEYYYERLYKVRPNNMEYAEMLAYSLVESEHRLSMALDLLKKVKRNKKDLENEFYYYYGKALMFAYDIDGAMAAFKQYKMKSKDKTFDNEVALRIQQCNNAKELIKHPLKLRLINLGSDINSSMDDYLPFLLDDGKMLLFTTNKHFDMEYEQYSQDIYYSFLDNGVWSFAKPQKKLNTEDNEELVAVAMNETRLFVRSNYYEDFSKIALVKRKNLSMKYIPEDSLQKPFKDNKGYYMGVSYDETNHLFYIAFSESPEQQTDIYKMAQRPDGTWGEPQRLSDIINTPYDEAYPMISNDGTRLYFASKGHNSMGGYDVFYSDYNSKTQKWSKPKNIGYPLNTVFDDLGIAYMPDGSAYIAGNHKGGMGGKDIYKVLFGADTNVMVVYTGQVIERQGSQKTPVTKPVSLTLLDNQKHPMPDKFKVNPKNHRYTLLLKPGSYTLVVKSEGYKTKNIRLRVTDVSKQTIITKEIVLEAEGQ